MQDLDASKCGVLVLQEVTIMRKVRHKNVVQFIGACTRKPNLCIVFEFMSGGSVYDYMRKVRSSSTLVVECTRKLISTALHYSYK